MVGHTGPIHSLSFSAESTVLVSGGADATVRVWDVLATPAPVGSEGGRKFEGIGGIGGTGKRLSTAGLMLEKGVGEKGGVGLVGLGKGAAVGGERER